MLLWRLGATSTVADFPESQLQFMGAHTFAWVEARVEDLMLCQEIDGGIPRCRAAW
jgi:hypothetical protein